MTNAPSQAVLVRVGSLAVVVDGRCELVFPAEVYATYAYECRNADVPVALSCEDGLAPFRGTESLSVTEPTEGHVGTVGVIPVLVVDPPRIAEGSAVGAQLRAAWNVPGASYAWRDQSDTAVFSSPNSNETSVASLDAATTLSVVATDGTHSATGTVAVTATGAVLPERAREPAALGWTTGTNAFGSAIAPDTLRPVWMSVVGDGAAGVAKRNDWTMTVPRGRAVYVAVYGASTEHPDWTRQGSQYNDVLIWNIHADGNRSVSGLERVNSLSESFAASGQNALNGVSPVAFLGGGFYVAPTNDVSGALAFDITAAFTNEVIGGRLDLTARVSNTVERTLPVFIRGKNPKDEVAKAYIDANVDADFRDFAWMIAKHESKQGSRAYNQFNPAGPKIELPNKTSGDARWGWGMCQIDRGRTGVVARTVYNWQDNVSQMNATLSEKLRTYNRFIGYYRSAYRLSPNWSEPDSVSTNIHGVSVSAKDWALLTLYNGSSGVVERVVSGRNFRSPVHFNESNGSWTFVTNVNDYVRKVCEDAARTSQD